jgi:cell wall-associated NlpC family hydrolase
MNILIPYAMSFLGTPYKWGGNNRLEGLDCSGFVIELLKSAAEPLPAPDMSAQALYDHYMAGHGEINRWSAGALVFFGDSASQITHVGMALDQYRMIEAAGGNALTLTPDDAKAKGAMIRIRPIKSRKNLVAIVKPRYAGIGHI